MKRAPLLVALFLAALALRPQLVGIGPLLPLVQDDLDVTHAVAGLLGTIPVLCGAKPGQLMAFIRLPNQVAWMVWMARVNLRSLAK